MALPSAGERLPPRQRAIRTAIGAATAIFPLVSGCAVVSVVSTVATVTAGAISTAVDVGAGALRVTGKVIGKGVEAMTGSGSPPSSDTSRVPKPTPN